MPPLVGLKALMMLAFIAVASLGLAAPSGPNRTITQADQGRTFACQVHDKLTVVIPNPASGGYNRVIPEFNPRILKLLSRKEVPPEPAPFPKLGDFGKIIFELEVIGEGQTDMVIRIARDWEINKSPEEYLKVKIKARRQG